MSSDVTEPTGDSPESDGDDEGYVHNPSGEPPTHSTDDTEFDWRGWTLVATVVFAFLVVPTALLSLPMARNLVASVGLTLRDAYLVLPLLPAFLLGAVAVWSAIRSRSS